MQVNYSKIKCTFFLSSLIISPSIYLLFISVCRRLIIQLTDVKVGRCSGQKKKKKKITYNFYYIFQKVLNFDKNVFNLFLSATHSFNNFHFFTTFFFHNRFPFYFCLGKKKKTQSCLLYNRC